MDVCEWGADECLGDPDMADCPALSRRRRPDVAARALHGRDSDYIDQLVAACADACEACTEERNQHDADHCQVCADVLSECAESRRRMAGA